MFLSLFQAFSPGFLGFWEVGCVVLFCPVSFVEEVEKVGGEDEFGSGDMFLFKVDRGVFDCGVEVFEVVLFELVPEHVVVVGDNGCVKGFVVSSGFVFVRFEVCFEFEFEVCCEWVVVGR